jgi:hypothetical protein
VFIGSSADSDLLGRHGLAERRLSMARTDQMSLAKQNERVEYAVRFGPQPPPTRDLRPSPLAWVVAAPDVVVGMGLLNVPSVADYTEEDAPTRVPLKSRKWCKVTTSLDGQ